MFSRFNYLFASVFYFYLIWGIYYHDCDDDGETAAGGRLGEILRIMGVCGIAVIVTRWYGGTKLGKRKKIVKIVNCKIY